MPSLKVVITYTDVAFERMRRTLLKPPESFTVRFENIKKIIILEEPEIDSMIAIVGEKETKIVRDKDIVSMVMEYQR